MTHEKLYDAAIIGGGLAGLTLSILLARKGFSVILFEKEKYPFHKVCGEYISMESWEFLTREIGLPLDEMNIPLIKKLQVTSPAGIALFADLDLGGFGISRYLLDNLLKETAEKDGVIVKELCKTEDISFSENIYRIKTTCGDYRSKISCGSWGKRSNIDIKWKRPFINKNSDRLNNYVGIKYHVTADFPADMIALHNFKDGYCGISKIENNLFCLCYFMKASNLKNCGNSIERVEREILSQNPKLKELLENITNRYDAPLSISQVSLSNKKAVENNVLMLGDAAGMISPLCGNGMSMAMHSAKLAAAAITAFLNKEISKEEMENNYINKRKEIFNARIKTGRFMQYLFGRTTATNIFVQMMKKSPYLTKKIINFTHGQPF